MTPLGLGAQQPLEEPLEELWGVPGFSSAFPLPSPAAHRLHQVGGGHDVLAQRDAGQVDRVLVVLIDVLQGGGEVALR